MISQNAIRGSATTGARMATMFDPLMSMTLLREAGVAPRSLSASRGGFAARQGLKSRAGGTTVPVDNLEDWTTTARRLCGGYRTIKGQESLTGEARRRRLQ